MSTLHKTRFLMNFNHDKIINNEIIVCQPIDGFRFSSDSIYLAWFANLTKSLKIVDIGSGSGIISALLTIFGSSNIIDAVELQPEMFTCLNKTIQFSGLEDSISPINADIKTFEPEYKYDIAICNPPYKKLGTGREPKNKIDLNARFTTTMSVDDVFSFCKSYLTNSGKLFLSYDAEMVADLFEAGLKYGFEPKRLMPICNDLGMKPKILLMEFRKGAGREMIFEPPLFQNINGVQTELDKNIMQGKWIEPTN
ncbi:MAG: SAM-dependent methyltransferase [Denitrovibrio sp.]|nr:MAG: SAM-dependent methyltransferase [Denitrovibrio sp.]